MPTGWEKAKDEICKMLGNSAKCPYEMGLGTYDDALCKDHAIKCSECWQQAIEKEYEEGKEK